MFSNSVGFLSISGVNADFTEDSEVPEDSEYGSAVLTNPLGDDKNSDPNILIGKIINQALGVVGSIGLVLFVYAGFTWMLAAGNAEKISKAKDIIIWTTLGMLVIFSAYAMVRFVLDVTAGG